MKARERTKEEFEYNKLGAQVALRFAKLELAKEMMEKIPNKKRIGQIDEAIAENLTIITVYTTKLEILKSL